MSWPLIIKDVQILAAHQLVVATQVLRLVPRRPLLGPLGPFLFCMSLMRIICIVSTTHFKRLSGLI